MIVFFFVRESFHYSGNENSSHSKNLFIEMKRSGEKWQRKYYETERGLKGCNHLFFCSILKGKLYVNNCAQHTTHFVFVQECIYFKHAKPFLLLYDLYKITNNILAEQYTQESAMHYYRVCCFPSYTFPYIVILFLVLIFLIETSWTWDWMDLISFSKPISLSFSTRKNPRT